MKKIIKFIIGLFIFVFVSIGGMIIYKKSSNVNNPQSIHTEKITKPETSHIADPIKEEHKDPIKEEPKDPIKEEHKDPIKEEPKDSIKEETAVNQTIVANLYYNPYIGLMFPERNEISGMEMKILKETINIMNKKYKINLTLNPILLNFDAILSSVNNDTHIAIGAGGLSYKKQKTFDSVIFFQSNFGILTNPNVESDIFGVEDGTVCLEKLKTLEKNVIPYPNVNLMVDAFKNGKIRHLFGEVPMINELGKKLFPNYIITVMPEAGKTKFNFILNKKNTDFNKHFKTAVKEAKNKLFPKKTNPGIRSNNTNSNKS